MKNLTTYFTKKNILFKDILEVEAKKLNSRKKIGIYLATSIKSEYYAIFIINAKSRFLIKNAQELVLMCESLALYAEHNFKKKELLISSPICSKAKQYLKDFTWNVRVDFSSKD